MIDKLRIYLACLILPRVWARCLRFQIQADLILNTQYEGPIATELGKLLVEQNKGMRRVK
jgi:hypothetical protein